MKMKFSVYTDYKKYVLVTRGNIIDVGLATLGKDDEFDLLTGACVAVLREAAHLSPYASPDFPGLNYVGEIKVNVDKVLEGVRSMWFAMGYASSKPGCPASLGRLVESFDLNAKLVLK